MSEHMHKLERQDAQSPVKGEWPPAPPPRAGKTPYAAKRPAEDEEDDLEVLTEDTEPLEGAITLRFDLGWYFDQFHLPREDRVRMCKTHAQALISQDKAEKALLKQAQEMKRRRMERQPTQIIDGSSE